jgi:hypothetical protein
VLWQLTVCLGCTGIYFSLYVLCCKTLMIPSSSLVCLIPCVNCCVKTLEAESETCNILLLCPEDYVWWLKNYIVVLKHWKQNLIFVCWLHFCLKQIFTSDVEHNVLTSRPVLYVLGLTYVYVRACLIEGIHTNMCWYEPCAIMKRSEHMWFLKELLKWFRKVFLMWLLISLFYRSFSIHPYCLMKKSLIRSEAWLKEWHAMLSI